MKSSAGLLIIIVAMFSLWLYNTGRLAGILAIIKGAAPGQAAPTAGGAGSSPGGTQTGGSGGGSNPLLSQACAADSIGMISPLCVAQIFGGHGVGDIVSSVEDGINSVTGLFGIHLF